MFSKYGRIFSIDVTTSQQSPGRYYWVGVFRTLGNPNDGVAPVDMNVKHHSILSRASVARVRRAQDRLMEGKP